jgi:2-polyprenyl-3-methyl-5-hydroxy-6-metoxy-1,4-benzoquinol methylase
VDNKWCLLPFLFTQISDILRNNKRCLLCSGKTEVISRNLQGSSSRGNKLYKFDLFQCKICHLIQKDVGSKYASAVKEIYEENYELPGGGRNVNIENGLATSRENQLIETLLEVGDLPLVGNFLDIGTGSGHLLSAFSKKLINWKIVAHDLNNSNEALIRENGASEFYFGNLEKITEKFDLITMNHVLEHVMDPRSVLLKASILLKSKGKLVVIIPTYTVTNTDFFFMEHCSHFTSETLNIAAAISGLRILNTLEGKLGTVEIGFLAEKYSEILDDAFEPKIDYSEQLVNYINTFPREKKLGIFGLNGAGMWLSVICKGKISFIIDDNPLKQNSTFAGIPILSLDDSPPDSTVLVAYNNPKLSLEMLSKLEVRKPSINFVVGYRLK